MKHQPQTARAPEGEPIDTPEGVMRPLLFGVLSSLTHIQVPSATEVPPYAHANHGIPYCLMGTGLWVFAICAFALLTVVLCAADENLVAHYRFDESSGTVLMDYSGQGNHGRIMGNPAWVTGQWGSALEFDGVDDWVDCGTPTGLSLGQAGSVIFWFKPHKVCQGGLVGWTAGEGKTNQRLVTALNTYQQDVPARQESGTRGLRRTWPVHVGWRELLLAAALLSSQGIPSLS